MVISADGRQFLESADALSRKATQLLAAIGVAGILVIAFVTILDIILRDFFQTTLLGLNEIVSLCLAIGVAACLPAGLSSRVNIALDVLIPKMPRPVALWLGAMASTVLLYFFILIAWRVGVVSGELAERSQTTMILLWPQAPFMYVVTLLVSACILVQGMVVVADCVEASRRTPDLALAILPIGAVILAVGLWMSFGGFSELSSAIGRLLPTSGIAIALLFFALMWVAMLLTVPLAAAMGLAGFFGLCALLGASSASAVLGSETVKFLTSETLAVLPMFLLMGSFATVAGLSSDIYRFAYELLKPLRGGLAHATIAGCAGFGALTGSSLATAATFGKIALPEMEARGYSPSLATGSVAAGGTLGSLVPPSAALILFALLTEESIGRLFIAAIIPAMISVVFYMAVIFIITRLRPDAAPKGEAVDWIALQRSFVRCWAAFLLFGLVIGGIYTGFFTDTEAASVGAGGAFLAALLRGKLSGGKIWEVMSEVTGTIALIYTLIFGAVTFSFLIALTQVPAVFTEFITSFGLPALAIIALLIVAYLILGMFMDSYAMMVITVPIFVPLIIHLGYSPIWFGVLTVMCVEDGMISPPFGLNIFVLRGVAPHVPINTIYRGCWPFVTSDFVKIVLVILFPWLALWLPGSM